MYERRRGGWIEVICGSMFSGKTEELVRRIRRAQIAGQLFQVFNHDLDKRYGEGLVASHAGASWTATSVQNADQILLAVEPRTVVVFIDEGHFFDNALVAICDALAESGRRVVVAGLDTDFRGEGFGPMPELMARAEKVDKLQAICVVCKEPASRTQRLINGQPAGYDDELIVVGAEEAYEARCRRCHEVPKK